MNRKDYLTSLIIQKFEQHKNEYGKIIYSASHTLKSGDVYLMGYNPGGEGNMSKIGDCFDDLNNRRINSYLDETWQNRKKVYKPGEAPLQKKICWILEKLGYNPKDVFATNLIFFQSRNVDGIKQKTADFCWEIHLEFLKIVSPKIILTFGNGLKSPYQFLRTRYRGAEEVKPAGQGNYALKSFETQINDTKMTVLGLPHLSWYHPAGKNFVINWIKERM